MKKLSLAVALVLFIVNPVWAGDVYLAITKPAVAPGYYKIVWSATNTSTNLQPITGVTLNNPCTNCLLIYDVSTLPAGTNYTSAGIFACNASDSLTVGTTTTTLGEVCSPIDPFGLATAAAPAATTGKSLVQ